MDINCKYVEAITEEDIKKVENKVEFKFPNDFLEFIRINNGGYPNKSVFKVNGYKESLKCFLSFNENSEENIIEYNVLNDEEGIRDTFVAIALDSFGNYIVFNREDKKIMFYEHEDESFVYLSDSFTEFLGLLEE